MVIRTVIHHLGWFRSAYLGGIPRMDKASGDYARGYVVGVAQAGAVLVAVAARELGYDHPMVERMVQQLGMVESGDWLRGLLSDGDD